VRSQIRDMATQNDESVPEAATLIAALLRLCGGTCRDCAQSFANTEALFSIALGFKDSPRCLSCLSRGLGREPTELRRQLFEYIGRRDCYRQAWATVCRGAGEPFGNPLLSEMTPSEADGLVLSAEFAEWDAGDMSCGDLVLALRIRINAMPPGSILRIIARDPAAPEDLPSWCRLTGHKLLMAEHPEYLIRNKET
jgi:tRNA 2-thiouridine synthesizing protein A